MRLLVIALASVALVGAVLAWPSDSPPAETPAAVVAAAPAPEGQEGLIGIRTQTLQVCVGATPPDPSMDVEQRFARLAQPEGSLAIELVWESSSEDAAVLRFELSADGPGSRVLASIEGTSPLHWEVPAGLPAEVYLAATHPACRETGGLRQYDLDQDIAFVAHLA